MRSLLMASVLAAFGAAACSTVHNDASVGTTESEWRERPADWTCAPCAQNEIRACAGALLAQPPFPAPAPDGCGLTWEAFPTKVQTCAADGSWGSCSFPKEAYEKLMSAACEVKHFSGRDAAVEVTSFEPKTMKMPFKTRGKVTLTGLGFDKRTWLPRSELRIGDLPTAVADIKVVDGRTLEITLPDVPANPYQNPGYLSLQACPTDKPTCLNPDTLTVGPIEYLEETPVEVFDACTNPNDGTGEKPIILYGAGFSKVTQLAFEGGQKLATVADDEFLRFTPAENAGPEPIRHDLFELSYEQDGQKRTYALPFPIIVSPNPYVIEITDISPLQITNDRAHTITVKGKGFSKGARFNGVWAFDAGKNITVVSDDVLTFELDPTTITDPNLTRLCASVELSYSYPDSQRELKKSSAKCVKVVAP